MRQGVFAADRQLHGAHAPQCGVVVNDAGCIGLRRRQRRTPSSCSVGACGCRCRCRCRCECECECECDCWCVGVGVDGQARGRQAGCRRVRSGRATHAAVHHSDPCADVASTDFEALFSGARTRLRNDLDPELDAAIFQQRLWGMFTVSCPHTLTLPQRGRVRYSCFLECDRRRRL